MMFSVGRFITVSRKNRDNHLVFGGIEMRVGMIMQEKVD